MFTGIIETTAQVLKKSNSQLIIMRPEKWDLFLGQSIATNGACLSVAEYTESSISFDVLSETFRKTNLGESNVVNLERAMSANGRFEGHVVLGHVDETIALLEKKEEESGIEYIFEIPKNKQYLVEKGSLCINGISLTLGNIREKTFSVYLIPLTLDITNLGELEVGDRVNIEYDYLAKLILNKK